MSALQSLRPVSSDNLVSSRVRLLHSVRLVCWAAIGCSLLSGCQNTTGQDQPTFSGSYPLRVECTTGMVADIVRFVGQDKVDVRHLMGPGQDPHLYKSTTADVQRLAAADMIFYNGLHLEGKMNDVFAQMARQGKPTIGIAETIPHENLITLSDDVHDPHVWFDLVLWSAATDAVARELSAFDPENLGTYRQATEQYKMELAKLHAYCQEQLALIPAERRVLVTAHDAFHYFGRAYGIEVKAIQGVSTETEAGVREINALVDFLVERKIPAVFVESSVSDRNVRALVEGCAAKGHTLAIGGELYSDALGPANSPAGTYFGMVRHNVDTIVRALQ